METVEVVIKIPKRTYDRVSERGIIAFGEDAYYIGHAIENGTVLPKGHGRLFDEKNCCTISGLISPENSIPIIEADKE